MSRFCKFGKLHITKGNVDKLLGILLTASKELKRSLAPTGNLYRYSTPGVSGWPPVFSAPVSCGKGNRPACIPAAASLCRDYFSCVPSVLLSAAVLPEKASCPIPAACSGVGTLTITSGQLVPK